MSTHPAVLVLVGCLLVYIVVTALNVWRIKQLECENTKLRKALGTAVWISCHDKRALPDRVKKVVVNYEGRVILAYYMPFKDQWVDERGKELKYECVYSWIDIPSIPEAEDDQR